MERKAKRRPKVCYLTSSLSPSNGWGHYSLSLLKALKQVGVSETVLLAKKDATHAPNGISVLPLLSSSSNGYLKPARIVRDWINIQRVVKDKKWDLVHCLTEDFIPLAALLAHYSNSPLIIHAVGTYSVQPLDSRLLRPLFVASYRKAAKVICISRFTCQQLVSRVALQNTEVIPLGVDFSKFEKCILEPQKRQERIVLTVGAIKYRKGMHVSLEAMKQVIKRVPNVRYEIVGPIVDRSLYTTLRQFVDRSGLQKRVAFLGKVSEEDLLARYRNCDVFLLTPVNQGLHFEGFGLVYLEANACGKPVIASKGCGAEEPVIDGYNGFLVPQADPNATAEAVEYLLRNPIVAERMGQNGIKRAWELRWENIAAKVLEVYTEVLE